MDFTKEAVSILSYPVEVALVDEMMEMAREHGANVDRMFCREICAQLRLPKQQLLEEFRMMCENDRHK